MAPREGSTNSANDFDVSIEEIIFSCGICQATVSEIYADKDKVHALSSSGDESSVVTKLWIADCSHVFCGKHLEGGGVPFHSKHEPPKARCPICVDEQKPTHGEKRALYAIRGLGKGEYDESVPDSYLRVPPMKLDSSDPAMDAMRFQYSHLVRYAKMVTKSWKVREKKRRAVEHVLSEERKQWRSQEVEMNKRIADLEQKEARLNGWEQRKAMIDHYMKMVTKMSEDIAVMRGQLLELGYQVPDAQYAFQGDDSHQKHPPPPAKQNASSATLAVSSSSRKRRHPTTHGDYADEEVAYDKGNHSRLQRDDSRELMPPPLHRGRPPQPSALPDRRVVPTQAQKHHSSQPPVQAYEVERLHALQPDVTMEDAYQDMPSGEAQRGTYHGDDTLSRRSSQVQVHPTAFDSRAPASGLRHGLDNPNPPYQPPQQTQAGYLSRAPFRPSHEPYETHPVEQDHVSPAATHTSQAPAFGNVYAKSGRASQQHMQQPLYTSYDPPDTRPRPMAPPSQVLSTPSLRRPLEPVAGPAESPFFASRAPFQTLGTQQSSAARSSVMQYFDAPPTRDGTMGRPVALTPRSQVHQSLYRNGTMPPPSAFGSQSHVRSSQSQLQHRYAGSPQREPITNSQAHPMSEAVYGRHDMTPLRTPRQAAPDLQHGRLTLPPSRSRPALMGSQDSRLSMIPGARGAAPSQNIHARQDHAAGYSQPRYGPSYSAARRPVQRR